MFRTKSGGNEVLGFCLMGNHFHLLVRMLPEEAFSDAEVRTRFQRYYGADSERPLLDGQLPTLRAKWTNLSDYVKELKQGFSRWYNKRHGGRGSNNQYLSRCDLSLWERSASQGRVRALVALTKPRRMTGKAPHPRLRPRPLPQAGEVTDCLTCDTYYLAAPKASSGVSASRAYS